MPTPNARRPRSASVVRSPARPRTSPLRPRSAPARMVTASVYKEMPPSQQLHYRKTVTGRRWPTDRRASKALLIAIMASMIKPSEGLFSYPNVAGLFALWRIGSKVDEIINRLSSGFPLFVICSIILISFAHTINKFRNTSTRRNEVALQRNQLALMRRMFDNMVQRQTQEAFQHPPSAGTPMLAGVPNRLPALPAPVPRSASPRRGRTPPRSASPRRVPTNAQLLAAMSNRPLARARRSPAARANR